MVYYAANKGPKYRIYRKEELDGPNPTNLGGGVIAELVCGILSSERWSIDGRRLRGKNTHVLLESPVTVSYRK
jgi:hypothetical protein